MKPFQQIGIFIFSTVMVILVATLSMNNYKLTELSFNESITNENHRQSLSPILQEMQDITYNSKIDFISDFNERFNGVNETLKEEEIYVEFFDKLSKSVFLEAYKI